MLGFRSGPLKATCTYASTHAVPRWTLGFLLYHRNHNFSHKKLVWFGIYSDIDRSKFSNT